MRHPSVILLALLMLALALAAPASARAARSVNLVAPPGAGAAVGDEVTRALELGERRFGPACDGGISITWNAFELEYDDDPGARAWARTFAEECRIEFNLGVWLSPAWRRAVYDWPWLCTLVVHEYGHLAGHGHVDDPNHIMHATIERIAPECEHAPVAERALVSARPAKARASERLRRTERTRRAKGARRVRKGRRRGQRRHR
jgi:hypothetical protein